MKILIVSHYFWPEQFRINDLVMSLNDRGHDVSVLTGMPNYPSGTLFEGYHWWSKRHDNMSGVPVHRVPMFLRRDGRGWQLALNYLSFVFFGCLFGPWFLRKQQFDAIFVFEPSPFTVGIPAAFMRRLKKAPMLLWVQDLWPESLQSAGAVNSPVILNGIERMVRWIYRRCDRVLIQSKGFVEPAIAAGALRERIDYFPNWAESFYRPISVPKNSTVWNEMPDGFCVMFAGNLGEAQSLETIVEAAEIVKNYPDIHWVILGSGRREKWLRDALKEKKLGETVHLLGHQPVETMPSYFSKADLLLVTLKKSPVFALTIPSKIQSYLACEKPILGSLDGEGAKVISDAGAGICVPAEDGKALADAALKLYRRSKIELEQMGKSGRDYYDRCFEREILLDQLEDMMKSVVKEGLCES